MKIAIIGSRSIHIENLSKYIPKNTDEIVSGGAKGVDSAAAEYAKKHKMPLTVFLPEYDRYGKAAPIKRNLQIIDYADCVIALWDGKSKGTKFVIDKCATLGKELKVYRIN